MNSGFALWEIHRHSGQGPSLIKRINSLPILTMNIIGLDVGRGYAVAAALSEFPDNPQRHFSKHRREIVKLSNSKTGLEAFIALEPAGIVLEPTGGWYSSFWRDVARSMELPVFWVGHADLSYQRGAYGFKNKTDPEDAFCLALTFFDERFVDRHGARRFLNYQDGKIEQLRRRVLEMAQLDKVKTALINQTRQRLALEFPEAVSRRVQQSQKDFSPFWGWLAGEHEYTRVKNEYSRSVAHDLNLEIQPYTRLHASRIVGIEQQQTAIEREVKELLKSPEFADYIKVFKRFGFGFRNQCLLLLWCYPFDKFLIDGKPWIDRELINRKDEKGKPTDELKETNRHRSLRSFQAYLGMSYKLKQSGDSLKKSFLGSDIVRSGLYMWCVDYICPEKVSQHTRVRKRLCAKRDELEQAGVTGKDKVTRLLFKTTDLLFHELARELT